MFSSITDKILCMTNYQTQRENVTRRLMTFFHPKSCKMLISEICKILMSLFQWRNENEIAGLLYCMM